MIPFLDLQALHRPLTDALKERFAEVLADGQFILGPRLQSFETLFAAYCEVKHCVGVGNGLDALHLLLRAYGIGPGDEVIVPAQTFIATWLAVSYAGATPVPSDVLRETGNIDPADVARRIGPKTRAVIAVHLHGQPADMDELRKVIDGRNICLIEDAAQAHGARYKGRRVGCLGDAAAFSFYPGKNLGALGDGGAIVTNDGPLACNLALLRNYGSSIKYIHELHGWNSRLDELQAALLEVKLPLLDGWNQARSKAAAVYQERLADVVGLSIPAVPDWAESAWHLFVVRTRYRAELQEFLRTRKIGSMIHYPILPHRQPAYAAQFATPVATPVADAWAAETLSLPMWPGVPARLVADAVCDFFTSNEGSFAESHP